MRRIYLTEKDLVPFLLQVLHVLGSLVGAGGTLLSHRLYYSLSLHLNRLECSKWTLSSADALPSKGITRGTEGHTADQQDGVRKGGRGRVEGTRPPLPLPLYGRHVGSLKSSPGHPDSHPRRFESVTV